MPPRHSVHLFHPHSGLVEQQWCSSSYLVSPNCPRDTRLVCGDGHSHSSVLLALSNWCSGADDDVTMDTMRKVLALSTRGEVLLDGSRELEEVVGTLRAMGAAPGAQTALAATNANKFR